MKYVSPEYQQELGELAHALMINKAGDLALADTVEFSLPPTLRLCDPPELGWTYTPEAGA